jgi:hypothetical protein
MHWRRCSGGSALGVFGKARSLSIQWTRVYWSWISMMLLKDFRTFHGVSWFFRGQTSEMDGRWRSAPWLARCVCEDGWIPSHFTDAVLLFPGFAQEQFMLIHLAEKVFSGSPSANWNTSCGGSQATWLMSLQNHCAQWLSEIVDGYMKKYVVWRMPVDILNKSWWILMPVFHDFRTTSSWIRTVGIDVPRLATHGDPRHWQMALLRPSPGPCVSSVLFITLPVCSRGVLWFDWCLFWKFQGNGVAVVKWGNGTCWNMLEHVGICWNMFHMSIE